MTHNFYGDWLDLGPLEQIPLRGARTVPVVGGEEIAVFRTGDNRVYALVNRCPHKGGPLAEGMLAGDAVVCPLHAFRFEFATGECDQPGTCPVGTYTVTQEGSDIYIAIPAS